MGQMDQQICAFYHKTDIFDVVPVWIFATTACPRTGPIPAQSRSPWVLGTRRSSWGRPSEWVQWTNQIGAFHHKTDIFDVGPVGIFAPSACPRTGPIPTQYRSPYVLETRRSSWGRPSEWVKWTNEIGAFHHKTDILDVGPVWIFATTACPRTGPIQAQSRSPWVLGTRRSSWGKPSEWVKWTNKFCAFHQKRIFLMMDPFGYSPLRLAPGRDLYQPNLGPHGCLEPGGRPGAGRLNGSNGPKKLVHFITKRIFFMLDPFGYSPLRLPPGRDLYQPNIGPHGCLEPGGRPGACRLNGLNGPTKLVHFITKRIFLMFDPFGYSPLRLAPGRDLYQPNLGRHRCLKGEGRLGAGRLNGSNGPTKFAHFITKRIFLMLYPFGYSAIRLAPGRDLYQSNLGPHGCLEPGGRPGAGRLNGSNGPTKLVHFITKRVFLMLDQFGYSPLRLAPVRDLYQPNLGPRGCLEPGGRPGAGRLNGSNGPTKLVHFIIKRIFLMLDPFGYSPLQLAPGRDLYQPILGSHGCLKPGGRIGAGRLNGSNGPTKLVHFITKRIFLMLDPFGYSPLRLAQGRDLYQPNLGPHGCLEPEGRPGASRLSGSNGPTKFAHFKRKRIFLMIDPFGYSPLRLAPGRDLYQPNLVPHGCLEPGGRPGAGRLNGLNGPTKLVHFITKRIFLMLDPFGYSPLRLVPGRDLYQPIHMSPWVLGTRRSSWGRPSEWVKWTNQIGAFHHKTDIFDVGPVRIFAPTACPRTGPIPAQSRSPWVLGTRGSSWGRPSEWVKWTNQIGAFHHKTDIFDVGPVWIFATTACPRTGPIPAQYRSPWVLGTRRSSWGRPSEWVKWTNEIGAFNHKTDIFDVGPVWIFAPTACPRMGPIPAQSRSPWVLGTRRSSWGRPSEWVKWTNEIGAFHHKTDIFDVAPLWIFAPTACPRTGPIPAQSRSLWVLGTKRSSWCRPSEWVKWTNIIGAFHHKTDIFDVGPVWIFAPTACPRTGPIPTQSRSTLVLETRRSSWGRPSEWVKWTNKVCAFHHKTDIFDVGPVCIFAPTACPRTGPIPIQSRSPWVLGTRRSSCGRPSEWVKWTNEIGAFHHKTDIFDVGPVWIFAPTACPRTGPIPAQSRSP